MRFPDSVRLRSAAGVLRPAAILVIVWTAFIIVMSRVDGRLAVPPVYDDVSYMLDAARRLEGLSNGGLPRVLAEYATSPPKSPYSTVMAAGAFLSLGMREWAPYVTNVLVVGALLGFAAYLLRTTGPRRRLAVLLMLLPIPLIGRAAYDFRPDLLSATLTAIGIVMALEKSLERTGFVRRLFIGAVFGAAMIVKPTAFPATLALAGAALGAAVIIDRPGDGVGNPSRSGVRSLLPSLMALLAVAFPYFVVGAYPTLRYIHYNLVGSGQRLWIKEMPLDAHARYYLDGQGGDFMLGWSVYPLVTVVAAWIIRCVIVRGGFEARRAVAMGALLAVAYAVCTIPVVKHVFFGLPFQTLLVFAGVMAARSLLDDLARWPEGSRLIRPGLTVLAAASICLVPFARPREQISRERAAAIRRDHEAVYTTILRHLERRSGTVLLTFTGPVDAANLEFKARQRAHPIRFAMTVNADAPEFYRPWLDRSDLVLALPSRSGMSRGTFPSSRILDEVVAYLDRQALFTRADRVPITGSRRAFILYGRRAGFAGFDALAGLGNPEGKPGPDGRPYQRWGFGPATRLAVHSSGNLVIRAQCRAGPVENQRIEVRADGRVLGEAAVGPGWNDLEIPIKVGPDMREIELVYADWQRGGPRPFAVLFRGLRIDPAPKDAPPARPETAGETAVQQ